MKTKKLLILAGSICLSLVLVALLLPACAAPAAPTPGAPAAAPVAAKVHRITHLVPFVENADEVSIFLGETVPLLIEEWTDGRIVFERVYYQGELVEADQQLEAVATGLADMATSPPGYYQGTIPVAEIEGGLPLGPRNGLELSSLLKEYGLDEILEEAYEEQGRVKHLWTDWLPTSTVLLSKNKVASVADFQGLKVMTFGAFLGLIDELGGVSTYIPWPERYSALATGVVDGIITNDTQTYDKAFYEVTDYMIDQRFAAAGGDTYFMNLDTWNSLEPDVQHLLTMAGWAHNVTRAMFHNKLNELARKKWIDIGQIIVTWPDAEWLTVTDAASAYWDEAAAKDEYCARGVAAMKAMLKDYGHLSPQN